MATKPRRPSNPRIHPHRAIPSPVCRDPDRRISPDAIRPKMSARSGTTNVANSRMLHSPSTSAAMAFTFRRGGASNDGARYGNCPGKGSDGPGRVGGGGADGNGIGVDRDGGGGPGGGGGDGGD